MKNILVALMLGLLSAAQAQEDTNRITNHALRFAIDGGIGFGLRLNSEIEFEYKGFFVGLGRSFQARAPLFDTPKDISYNKVGLGYNYRAESQLGFMVSIYFGQGNVVETSLERPFFFPNTVERSFSTTTQDLNFELYYKFNFLLFSIGTAHHVNKYFSAHTFGIGLAADIDF